MSVPHRRFTQASLRLRLIGIALLCLALAGLPATSLFIRLSGELASLRTEQRALQPSRALQEALSALIEHRELAVLPDNEAPRLKAAQQAADKIRRAAEGRPVAQQADSLWLHLLAAAAELSKPPRRGDLRSLLATHRQMADDLLQLLDRQGTDSGLLLDPDPATNFAFRAALVDSPRVADALSELSTLARAAAIDDIGELAAARSRYLTAVSDLQAHLQQALAADAAPQRTEALSRTLKAIQTQRPMVTAALDTALLDVNYPLDEMVKAFGAAAVAQRQLAAELTDSNEVHLSQRTDRLSLESLLLGLSLAGMLAAVGWMLYRLLHGILDSVMRAVRITERIALGDLSRDVRVQRDDELGRVLRAVAQMQDRLREMMGDIHLATSQMSEAASDIAQGSQELQGQTSEAAAGLGRAAEHVNGLGNTVRNSASAAQMANDLATEAAQAAAQGGQVVEQVVETISAIHESSGRIAAIVGVIDGLAFQTNILALNAAVEAARAGESGRGFAVVAAEVRALAQRSATAAREIGSLIGTSVERIEEGTRLTRDAGASMHRIVDSVGLVSGMIGGIAKDAESQAASMDQVVAAMQALDRLTRDNAQRVQVAAQASGAVQAQADRMRDLVSGFQLREREAGTPMTAP